MCNVGGSARVGERKDGCDSDDKDGDYGNHEVMLEIRQYAKASNRRHQESLADDKSRCWTFKVVSPCGVVGSLFFVAPLRASAHCSRIVEPL
jgi:hypothetical protein